MAKRDLNERVADAAVRALNHQKHVSPVDVLMGMGMLPQFHFERWQRGQVPDLESSIQCGARKLDDTMKLFLTWARERGLKPHPSSYTIRDRGGETRPLKVSASGDPEIERIFTTRWVSELPERKQQKVIEKAAAPKEIVVFSTLRDSKCSECQEDLPKGSFLTMENGGPLCLECADLDHLEYLPRGDAALTRRSGKYSALRAVVVRFSRSRGRYERQGILVEPAALEKAEDECLADEEVRERRRERDAERRGMQDADLIERMTERILDLYPGCPAKEAAAIAAHTAARGSGRVGRTEAGRALEPEPLRLAVIAAVRHRHTDYDELLMKGVDRSNARRRVSPGIEALLDEWS
jgi:hypothetical protein